MLRKLTLLFIGISLAVSFSSAQDSAKTFILVHGAFQDSTSWEAVIPLLEAEGHTALSLDLPGHGADETPFSDITLADYRDAVVELIEQQEQPVILVGHSFGGIVISEVAEAIPDRIEALVYVAAYLPRTGDSLAGLAALDRNNGFSEENFLLAEDFSYAYVLEADFLTIFCGDCTEDQASTVMATRQNEPLAPLNEPSTVTAENFGTVRKVYILTAEDNAASPQIQIFMLSQTPVDQVYALNTSHVPFVTMPDQLTALLIAATGE
ncbi:MAG: alpha/beta fold hydrolase [Anaerolineae bacterium]|jgi:pimeloyl-ACP methyl ester carboxylesterase|nr:alpha/beta fold hydrolase [Anaerolineae bacterium]